MGYRSDVAMVFYAAKNEEWPTLKLWLQENFPVGMFEAEIQWNHHSMQLVCENVKWYDDYDEVKAAMGAFNKFVDMFCEGDKNTVNAAAEFVRVGENYEDICTEYHGECCGYALDVSRQIIVGKI